MVSRLRHRHRSFARWRASCLATKASRRVTGVLLAALADRSMMVRRAAGFARANVSDPSVIPQLLERYRPSANDEINVRAALECALDQMGADYTSIPD